MLDDLVTLLLAWLTTSLIGNASLVDILCSLTTPPAWAVCSWLWYQAVKDRAANESAWRTLGKLQEHDRAWRGSAPYRAAQDKYLRQRGVARERVINERSRWYIAGLFVLVSLYGALAAPQAVRPELRLYSLLISLVVLVGIAALVHSAIYAFFARRWLDHRISGKPRPVTRILPDLARERRLETMLDSVPEEQAPWRRVEEQIQQQQLILRLAALQVEIEAMTRPERKPNGA